MKTFPFLSGSTQRDHKLPVLEALTSDPPQQVAIGVEHLHAVVEPIREQDFVPAVYSQIERELGFGGESSMELSVLLKHDDPIGRRVADNVPVLWSRWL